MQLETWSDSRCRSSEVVAEKEKEKRLPRMNEGRNTVKAVRNAVMNAALNTALMNALEDRLELMNALNTALRNVKGQTKCVFSLKLSSLPLSLPAAHLEAGGGVPK